MTTRQRFELLAKCYRSDLARLDFIAEGAFLLSQLTPVWPEDEIPPDFVDRCHAERCSIQAKLDDLEDLLSGDLEEL